MVKSLQDCFKLASYIFGKIHDQDKYYCRVSHMPLKRIIEHAGDPRVTKNTIFLADIYTYLCSNDSCVGVDYFIINKTRKGKGVALLGSPINWELSWDNCKYSERVDVSMFEPKFKIGNKVGYFDEDTFRICMVIDIKKCQETGRDLHKIKYVHSWVDHPDIIFNNISADELTLEL